jgi:hypothetical protein
LITANLHTIDVSEALQKAGLAFGLMRGTGIIVPVQKSGKMRFQGTKKLNLPVTATQQ